MAMRFFIGKRIAWAALPSKWYVKVYKAIMFHLKYFV